MGSTAIKLLAAWAAEGQAVRLPSTDAGGRKPAARWAPRELASEETVTKRTMGSRRRKKGQDSEANNADGAASTARPRLGG